MPACIPRQPRQHKPQRGECVRGLGQRIHNDGFGRLADILGLQAHGFVRKLDRLLVNGKTKHDGIEDLLQHFSRSFHQILANGGFFDRDLEEPPVKCHIW